MALTLSPADMIRTASGVLMLAVGAALLVARWRLPMARGVGLVLAGIGTMGAFTNFATDEQGYRLASNVLAASGLLAALAGTMGLLIRSTSRAVAWSVASVSALLAYGMAQHLPPIAPAELYQGELPLGRLAALAYSAFWAPFPLLACAVGLAWAHEAKRLDARQARGRALLAFGLAFFPVVTFLVPGRILLQGADPLSVLLWVPSFAAGLALGFFWARRRPTAGGAATFLALGVPAIASALLLLLVAVADAGVYGIARLVGLAAAIVAILRYDALDAGFRATAMRRGANTSLFIAVIFVVAEILQNFLSAEYGLLIGGAVAGTLLVAARPIERALARTPAQTPVAPERAARERSYAAAVRRALRDGALGREEERELILLAEHLGIPASRAYELRDEIEREPTKLP